MTTALWRIATPVEQEPSTSSGLAVSDLTCLTDRLSDPRQYRPFSGRVFTPSRYNVLRAPERGSLNRFFDPVSRCLMGSRLQEAKARLALRI
jgi:hypothetical protein